MQCSRLALVDASSIFLAYNAITGIVSQLGETSVAIITLVSARTFILDQFLKESWIVHKMIAVYTFLGGWLGKDIKLVPIWLTRVLLMAVWLFVVLMTMLGNVINRGKHFQSPTPVGSSDC